MAEFKLEGEETPVEGPDTPIMPTEGGEEASAEGGDEPTEEPEV